jgi:CRP-like cAMP-binding protein
VSTTPQLVGPYERLLLLKAVTLSGHPPVAALGALARQAAERHLDAGASIIDPETWDRVCVVVEGRVSVYEAGRQLYSAGAKEAFGLLEVLARAGGDVEARADLDTLMLEIRATTLLSILEDHFGISLGMIQALARRLVSTPSWLSSSVERRIQVPTVIPQAGLDLINRIKLLQTSDLFGHARVGSLAEMATQFEEFRVRPGTALWREGDSGGWLLVLLDGSVDCSSGSGLRFSWTPGTVPGAFDALAAAPRWHDAVAATAVTGLRLSAECLFYAIEDDFATATDLLWMLAARVRSQRHALGGPHQSAHDTRD